MSDKVGFRLDVRVIFGIGVIIVGVILLLDRLGIHSGIDIWELWPVIPILIGLSLLLQPPETRQALSGSIILTVGVLFLLDNLDIIPYAFDDFWPVIVILVGIMILTNAVWGFRKTPTSSDFINLSFILGGGDFKFNTKNLKGGKVSAIMGGGAIDLREADIQEQEIVLDTFACMGGIEIRVPQNWEVTLKGTPLLGGMDNKTSFVPLNNTTQPGKGVKKLTIKGMAIMGGVEVKN